MTDISRGLELSNVGPTGLHLVEKKSGQLLHGGMTDELDDFPKAGNDLPSGLINHANTCFLASATRTLVTIPSTGLALVLRFEHWTPKGDCKVTGNKERN